MKTVKPQLVRAALFAILAGGFAAAADAGPISALGGGSPSVNGNLSGFGNNAGSVLQAGPAGSTPAVPMPAPVPEPALLPPPDLVTPPAPGSVKQAPLPQPTGTPLPEPRSAALVLGGLALMGLATSRRAPRR